MFCVCETSKYHSSVSLTFSPNSLKAIINWVCRFVGMNWEMNI